MAVLTAEERAGLLQRAWALDAQIFPQDRSLTLRGRPAALLREAYFSVLGEYVDRLPRVLMSRCPFTRKPFLHSFDPWGLDGPWWLQGREIVIDEPGPPPSFRVLLGAVAFKGRTPAEAREPVVPGPEVPFVVPRLLHEPGMVAVVSRIEMLTGDVAYPVAYFSQEQIPPERLHQFWLEQDLWFTNEDGKESWLIANDIWDFDLVPWIASGQLRWLRPGDPMGVLVDGSSGERCPFVDLPGERMPCIISSGERNLLPLPDGEIINPFED